MNKKYIPSALILYLNYFIHGVGCSILGQAVIKEALAASWGVEVMAITAISAALGLGRLIALPFAGPLSDKLGRRISTAIGSGSYAIYLIGLALAFNAGTNGGYQIAYICAIVGGIANSFLDTGIYPAVSEIIYKAPGVATMGIKFFISVSQMLLPFVLGVTVATTATGATSYNTLFYACGIAYLVLLVLVMIFPLPDTDQKAAGKKEGLIDSLKHTHAIYLIGLALAFNAGTNGGYQIAYICAIVGGIANSFLDTGIYPAVSEIIYKAPGVATMAMTFRCPGVEKSEDCTVRNISKVNIRFVPDKGLKLVNGSTAVTRSPANVAFSLDKPADGSSGGGNGGGNSGEEENPLG